MTGFTGQLISFQLPAVDGIASDSECFAGADHRSVASRGKRRAVVLRCRYEARTWRAESGTRSWQLGAGSWERPPASRRAFLNVTAGGRRVRGAGAAGDRAGAAGAAIRGGAARVVRPPMRWAQLTLVENDPGRVRSAVLARLLPPHARRRRLPQRRRHRRLLPDRGAAAPSQRLARRRAIRSATLVAGCRALRMHVVARTDPHAARDDVRARASGLDCRRRRRPAAPALGEPGAVGHLRARSLQLRVHGPGAPRDRHAVQGRRDLRQPLGAAGRRLLLRALPAELQGRDRRWICRASTDAARSGAPRVRRVAQGAADRAVEALGRDGPRAPTRTRGFIPNGPPDLQDRRRAGGDPVRRPPGAPRRDAAVGQRPARARNTAR